MKRIVPALLFSFLFALLVCMYMPLVTYFTGVSEFPFKGRTLFFFMLPFLFAMWGALCLLLLLLSRLLPYAESRLFKRTFFISPADIFTLALIIALLIEGAVISKGLPSVTGESGLFASTGRMLLDGLMWVLVMGCMLTFWRKLTKFAAPIAFGAALLMLAGVCDAYINKGPEIDVYTTRHTVLTNLAFHKQQNTLVLLLDAMPTRAVQQTLKNAPSLAEALDGFILFPNNLAPGGQTTWAVPGILGGAPYSGGDYQDFANKAFSAPQSLSQSFLVKGYDVYFSGMLPRFCSIWLDNIQGRSKISPTATPELAAQLYFRFVPYLTKQWVETYVLAYFYGGHLQQKDIGGIIDAGGVITGDIIFYQNFLNPSFTRESLRPTLHFHHLVGVHKPYVFNAEGIPLTGQNRSTEEGLFAYTTWQLHSLAKVFQSMKNAGLYDTATIIIMADHGDTHNVKIGNAVSMQLAAFMVKPPNATGALRLSEAPMASSYLPELATLLRERPQEWETYLRKLPNTRLLGAPPDKLYAVTGVTPQQLIFKEIPIDATQTPVVLSPNVTYTTARAFVSAKHPLAVPSKAPFFSLSGGTGYSLFATDVMAELKFLLKTQKKAVRLKISLDQGEWKVHGEKTPIHLTIHDLNTNKVLYDNPKFTTEPELWLEKVSLDVQGEVSLGIKWQQPERPGSYFIFIRSLYFE